MNLTPNESKSLALEFKKSLKKENNDVVICPSFSALALLSESLKKTNLKLGSQNIFWKDRGAYTGEESIRNLKELNCQYTIIGHSERRKYLNEDNGIINKKVHACIENGIIPILCIGENLEERQEGQTEHVLYNQIHQGLKGIEIMPAEKIIIAYEPVWAIGTGQAIDMEKAQVAFNFIYHQLADLWPLTIVDNNASIVYGGSVDEEIAKELKQVEKINGFLVGGVSLDAEKFAKIIKNFI